MLIHISYEQWIIQTRARASRSALTIKVPDRNEFHPSLSLSLQKWKPKGTALQHMVSGLCLDSQTPTGPPVITQCHPQMASQSWEPQIITWATTYRGRGRSRYWTQPQDSGDQSAHCRLTEGDERSQNFTFVMSTLNSCSLCRESRWKHFEVSSGKTSEDFRCYSSSA